jgi:hypothetical protein
MMRVAGEVNEVARRAAGAFGRPSVVEVLALFDVSDAPNLYTKINKNIYSRYS